VDYKFWYDKEGGFCSAQYRSINALQISGSSIAPASRDTASRINALS